MGTLLPVHHHHQVPKYRFQRRRRRRCTCAAQMLGCAPLLLMTAVTAAPSSSSATTVVLRSDTVLLNLTVSPTATFIAALALHHPDPSPIGCAAGFTTNILSPSSPATWGTQLGLSNTGAGFVAAHAAEQGKVEAVEPAVERVDRGAGPYDLTGEWRGSKGPASGIRITQTGSAIHATASHWPGFTGALDGSNLMLSGGLSATVGKWKPTSPDCSDIRGSTGWWWCRSSVCGAPPPAPPPKPEIITGVGWYAAAGGGRHGLGAGAAAPPNPSVYTATVNLVAVGRPCRADTSPSRGSS